MILGLSAVKIENITIHKQIPDRCFCYNVPIEWQLSPFNQSRVISFTIWLTRENQDIGNKSIIDSSTPNGNLFNYTFLRLTPDKYTAHIQCYTSAEDLISYANITFWVKRKVLLRDVISTNISPKNGYLFIHWAVPENLRYSATPVSFNMTLCENSTPVRCAKGVKTMCKAIYYFNGSSPIGNIQLYEENWKKYVSGEKSDVDTNMSSPLLKSWDKRRFMFGCGIYLEACKKLSFYQSLKYYVHCGDNLVGTQFDGVSLNKGFSNTPQLGDDYVHFNRTTSDPNRITAEIRVRFKVTCAQSPARLFFLRLMSSGKEIYKSPVVNVIKTNLPFPGQTYEKLIQVSDLIPHSNYTVQIKTTTRVKPIETTTTRTFTTPEGVPNRSPELQPTFLGVHDCTGNKRNVTVNWKFPDRRDRNGVIRNVIVKYFTKNSASEFIYLPRVTRTTIFGLECNAEYSVQVRVCNHGNTSCSDYSKARIIAAYGQHDVDSGRRTEDTNILPLSLSVGLGVPIIFIVSIFCLYRICRKKKESLEPLAENDIKGYYNADDKELSEVGDYSRLEVEVEDDETKSQQAGGT